MKKAEMKIYKERLLDLRSRLRGDVSSMPTDFYVLLINLGNDDFFWLACHLPIAQGDASVRQLT